MRVTVLQQDIAWADGASNRDAATRAIASSPRSDVYVLPEMFSTGFTTDPAGIAEKDSETLQWMQRKANELNAAIAGSVATQCADKYYNRFYFVMPSCGQSEQEGTGINAVSYDKHHLFTYGGEDKKYTKGDDRVIVEWRGVRFLLQVCYDLRFPVFSRNSVGNCNDMPYDCIIYVASWPESRRRVWDILLRARALENQCYVCGVNRVGSDPVCKYNGGSCIIDAYGRTIAECEDDKEASATADIDIEKLNAFRKKFPVLNDAD